MNPLSFKDNRLTAFAILGAFLFCVQPSSAEACEDLDGDGWTTCQNDCDDTDPSIHPGAPDNTCDGISNDCDSKIDEDYKVGSSSCGIGACYKYGNVFCLAGGILYDTCNPHLPADDDSTCDGKDDDCDGLVDEDYASVSSSCGTGACTTTGTTQCSGGKVVPICEPLTATQADDNCDGVDDDCDGQTDEHFVSLPTSCGIGGCAKTGHTYCFLGAAYDTCSPGNAAPADTACNGKDDDCDGDVDEDYVPTPFTCGISVCQNTVMSQCIDGGTVIDCTPLAPTEADEDCDGVDDDCDGSVDEHFAFTETTCGVGMCARTGKTFCMLSNVYDTCNPPEPAADDSSCNGKDDDCDGFVDEDFVAEVTSCGMGGCSAQGLSTCIDGVNGSTCTPGTPLVGDATCNGVDDDCDGAKDENYSSTLVECGEGACLKTGNIYCSLGVELNSCISGIPNVMDASCDGIDDDCDGQTDEDFTPGVSSCGKGVCETSGVTTCVNGLESDVCSPLESTGEDNNCNGVDEDCDGALDEHFFSGLTTECGVGKCASTGTFVCQAGTLFDICTPGYASPDDSSCNGIDDDCDGLIDEDYAPTLLNCGVGMCASTGATLCEAGQVVSTCIPADPMGSDDNCDGIDNDCDGSVDEHFGAESTSCGVGACASEGSLVCMNGALFDTCMTGNSTPGDFTCDGVDDDCDGQMDEDFAGEETSCGLGNCLSTGMSVCVDGAVVDGCVPGQGVAMDTTCDGLDDDCDGAVDEDFLGAETFCGQGACVATGTQSCDEGVIADSCEALAPGAEEDATCDGIDEDCDGSVDEDFVSEETACGQGPCAEVGSSSCENGEVVSDCAPGLHAYADASCKNMVCSQDPFCCESGWDQVCATLAQTVCAACVDPNVACCSSHEAPGCGDVSCEESVCMEDAFCCEGSWDASCVAIAEVACSDCMLPTTEASCCETGPQVGCNDLECQATVCQADGYCCSMGWDDVCVEAATDLCPTCEDKSSTCCVSHDGVGCNDAPCEIQICDADAYCCGVLWDATCALAASLVCEVCEEPQECCEDCLDDTCNGMDDDCDGQVDEDFVAEETLCGTGGCASTGEVACVEGVVVNTCMPSLPESGDLCDGIDNDCDGSADEDFVSEATSCGVGSCDAEGVTQCQNGALVDTCQAPVVTEADTACDGIDNDCDGEIDEDFVSVLASCGVGACVAQGPTLCVEGVEVVTDCTPGQPSLFDATCDGVDEDCDGSIDEDFEGEDTTCDVGSCAASGKTLCEGGAIVDSCEIPEPAEFDTQCNGVDDDCDGEIDEDFISGVGTCGLGACASTGPTHCVNGAVAVVDCVPGIAAEDDATCDDVDNDCDGEVDEDFAGEATTCDVGSCAASGNTLCVAGQVLDTCQAPVPAEMDTVCDGIDNDCDGEIDEDYISEVGTCGVGACGSEGDTACELGQVVVVNCTPGEPALTDSTCDGVDDDCDGEADEDFVGEVTNCDAGVCISTGETQCKNGQVIDTCVQPQVAENDTLCDGRDNDCDGEIDEDYVSEVGTCGVGACGSEGPTACVAGIVVVTSCTPGTPAAGDATCDGIDDDCDGEVDEDFVGSATTCETGTCGATGETQCSNGQIVDTCVPPVAAPMDNVCDGIDNDCDGEIDEDYQVAITTCGEGLCGGKGRAFCVNGALLDTCLPKESPYRNDVTCDGIDDDCDGEMDEDYAPEPTHCGVGVCLNTGETQCVSGHVEHFCVPGAPLSALDATCDGLDDNCNGVSDEDFETSAVICEAGACSTNGILSCEDGTETIECEDVVVMEGDVTCDGMDDDCDGLIDEDFIGEATVCGTGACGNTGESVCEAGQVVDTCETLASGAESTDCDGLDNDCDGEVDEDCTVPPVEECDGFVVTQGDWTRTIQPFESGQTVADFYSYGTPVGASANTGLEMSDESVMFLHRDPQGVLSFVMLHDAAKDGSGGSLKLEIQGLQDAELAVQDDLAHQADLYAVSQGLFSWVWYACCTDGLAFENIGEDACFTLEERDSNGLDSFTLFSGGDEMSYEALPSMEGPITICRQNTCEEPETCVATTVSESVCNGIDDDCDGEIDEDAASEASLCGVGACRSVGELLCEDGEWVDTCEAGEPSQSDRFCDNVDNDCDGEVDEDFVENDTVCGVGSCMNSGTLYCQDGEVFDTCEAGLPTPEVCDGADNDCDGEVDEDTAPSHFVVTQGNFSAPLHVLTGLGSSTDFYGETETGSNTGYEADNTSVWTLYEDPDGILSLVVHNDHNQSKHGGALAFSIDGLEEGTVVVGQENTGIATGWNATYESVVDEDLSLSLFDWKWRKGTNDGMVIEDISPELCITVNPRKWRHMDGFAMMSGTGEMQWLPSKSETFTLCRAEVCAPGVL